MSKSDHTILVLTLSKEVIIHENGHNPNQYRSKSSKIKTIILEETTEEQWEKFKQRIEDKLKEMNLRHSIIKVQQEQLTNTEDLERNIQGLWDKFENLLISSAFYCLKYEIQKKRKEIRRIIQRKRHKFGHKEYGNFRKAQKIKSKWNKLVNNLDHQQNTHQVDNSQIEELVWLNDKTKNGSLNYL
jgi:ElaB/YqjD/DUF883 family membrane-anchored ribosome-binding protein